MGAKSAKPVASMSIVAGRVFYRRTVDGNDVELNVLPRTDLRRVARDMRVGGEGTATNAVLRERIKENVEAHGGTWTNPYVQHVQRVEPTETREYPKTRYCPNGHGEYVFKDATAERLHTGKCATCRDEFVDVRPMVADEPDEVSIPDYVAPKVQEPTILERILTVVRTVRNRIKAQGLRVDVSPRTTFITAALVKRGFSLRDALSHTEIGTLNEEQARTLLDRLPLGNERTSLEGLPEMPRLHHPLLPEVVAMMQAGCHVYLAGPKGTGKSTMGEQAGSALGLPVYYQRCSPDMSRAMLDGRVTVDGTYMRSAMREALENGGVYVLDEIDNGNPGILASLNSLLANGVAAFPDGMVNVHPDFRVVATANTWGTGPTAEFQRARVDPATLDRFARVYVAIDESLEEGIAAGILTETEGE